MLYRYHVSCMWHVLYIIITQTYFCTVKTLKLFTLSIVKSRIWMSGTYIQTNTVCLLLYLFYTLTFYNTCKKVIVIK
jgi:hypothetical protein